MTPARFIAIEGLDGSGGSTQLALLKAEFERRGQACVVSREPSDGPVGKLIRAQLAGGVSDGVLPYLFAADRRDHFDSVILPALARGENVLSDRCALSSLAYQAEAHGLGKVMRLNEDFPPPDLVILLDLDPAECLARIAARGLPRDRFETLERLRTIAAGYDAAVRAVGAVGAEPPNKLPGDFAGARYPGRSAQSPGKGRGVRDAAFPVRPGGLGAEPAGRHWTVVRVPADGTADDVAARVTKAVWPA